MSDETPNKPVMVSVVKNTVSQSNKDYRDSNNNNPDTQPLINNNNNNNILSSSSNTSINNNRHKNESDFKEENVKMENYNDLPIISLTNIVPVVANSNSNQNIKTQINNNININTNNISNDDTSSINGNANSIMCRICHCEEISEEYLISPCYCTGTLRYVHQTCLQQWLKSNGMKSCELCKFDFIMQTKIRSFKNWEKLDMNNIERRKILCSVTFHVIAITCVIWSLYVLIERTADEIKMNSFDWAFWTKLVVVAIGFTGGVVFMYIQCKMYFQLCLRWRQYNREIIIQPITDEILKNSRKKISEKNNTSSFTFLNRNSSKNGNNNNSKINNEDNLHTTTTTTTNVNPINQINTNQNNANLTNHHNHSNGYNINNNNTNQLLNQSNNQNNHQNNETILNFLITDHDPA